jgi:uncharacterized SAM-binding protein YcdF (DUF218 family)
VTAGFFVRSILALAIFGAIAFFIHAGRFVAHGSEEPALSDLLVILGGGVGDRVVKGFEILERKLAATILITGVWNGQVIDRFKSYDDRIKYLEDRGVSRDAIHIDAAAKSSWEEALLVRRFMAEKGLSSANIVSDPPHMRRLSWVYGKVFQGTSFKFRLSPSNPSWWRPESWWARSQSRIFVFKELAKIIYYRFEYES